MRGSTYKRENWEPSQCTKTSFSPGVQRGRSVCVTSSLLCSSCTGLDLRARAAREAALGAVYRRDSVRAAESRVAFELTRRVRAAMRDKDICDILTPIIRLLKPTKARKMAEEMVVRSSRRQELARPPSASPIWTRDPANAAWRKTCFRPAFNVQFSYFFSSSL